LKFHSFSPPYQSTHEGRAGSSRVNLSRRSSRVNMGGWSSRVGSSWMSSQVDLSRSRAELAHVEVETIRPKLKVELKVELFSQCEVESNRPKPRSNIVELGWRSSHVEQAKLMGEPNQPKSKVEQSWPESKIVELTWVEGRVESVRGKSGAKLV